MKNKTYYRCSVASSFSKLFVLFLVLTGCSASLTIQEGAQVDAASMWNDTFPNKIIAMDSIPGGLLRLDVAESEADVIAGKADRYILDGDNGSVIWKGNIWSGNLLAGQPNPVMLTFQDWSHQLKSLAKDGKQLWEVGFDGMYVVAAYDHKRHVAIILSVNKAGGNLLLKGVLRAINLSQGKVLWTKDIGNVQIADQKIGNVWRTLGDILSIEQNNVWLVLDSYAYNLNIANGEIKWKRKIVTNDSSAGDGIIWAHDGDNAVIANNDHIVRLNSARGISWIQHLGAQNKIVKTVITSAGVIAQYQSEEVSGVALVDMDSGGKLWRHETEFDDFSVQGIVVEGKRVFYATDEELIALELRTGREIFRTEVDDDYASLSMYRGKLILNGVEYIEARDPASGRQLWQRGDFQTPLNKFKRGRVLLATVVSASMAASAAISNQQSATYGRMSIDMTKQGRANTWDSGSRMRFAQMSQTAGMSSASATFGMSLMGVSATAAPFSDEVFVPWTSVPVKYAYFLQISDTTSLLNIYALGKLVRVDLVSGDTKEYPVPMATFACIPAVLVDQDNNRIYQAYHVFPLCKSGGKLDVLRLDN